MCEFISGLIGAILGLLFCVFGIPFLLIITDNNLSWEQVDWLKYQLMGEQVRYKKA